MITMVFLRSTVASVRAITARLDGSLSISEDDIVDAIVDIALTL